jgi:hypothetical protein
MGLHGGAAGAALSGDENLISIAMRNLVKVAANSASSTA